MAEKPLTAQEKARLAFERHRRNPTGNYTVQGGKPGGGSGTHTRQKQPEKNMPGPPEGWLDLIARKLRGG